MGDPWVTIGGVPICNLEMTKKKTCTYPVAETAEISIREVRETLRHTTSNPNTQLHPPEDSCIGRHIIYAFVPVLRCGDLEFERSS